MVYLKLINHFSIGEGNFIRGQGAKLHSTKIVIICLPNIRSYGKLCGLTSVFCGGLEIFDKVFCLPFFLSLWIFRHFLVCSIFLDVSMITLKKKNYKKILR